MAGDPDTNQTAGNIRERRSFPRRRAKGMTRYRLSDRLLAPGVQAKLADISQGGACLLVKESLPTGVLLHIDLIPPTGTHTVSSKARVCWSAPLPDGLHRVGCCWEHRLEYSALQKFV